jgi:hypothetical protein
MSISTPESFSDSGTSNYPQENTFSKSCLFINSTTDIPFPGPWKLSEIESDQIDYFKFELTCAEYFYKIFSLKV